MKKTVKRIPQSYSEGFLAFTQGKLRVVPVLLLTEKGPDAAREWYRGWDAANIAAPVPEPEPKPRKQYVVISYDSDQDQFFDDTVIAEDGDQACLLILKVRDYATSARSYSQEDLDYLIKAMAEPADYDADDAVSECQNCGTRFTESKLVRPIPDIEQRVDPGESMPSGECPDCGALCQEVEDK